MADSQNNSSSNSSNRSSSANRSSGTGKGRGWHGDPEGHARAGRQSHSGSNANKDRR